MKPIKTRKFLKLVAKEHNVFAVDTRQGVMYVRSDEAMDLPYDVLESEVLCVRERTPAFMRIVVE